MKTKYLEPITLYGDIRRRYDELSRVSQDIKRRLVKYPDGKIRVANKKGKIQYFIRYDLCDKTGTYVSKKDDKKIRLYLQKRYDEEVILKIEQEMKVLKQLLKFSDSDVSLIQSKYSDNPEEVKGKITPIDVSDEDYVSEWLNRPYDKKMINSEVPMFITNNGEHVRSKSELTIANALSKHGIPYKYECPLKLSTGQIIHPDFTVLNVRSRKELYWEHRGMLDDENYSRNSVNRIKQMGKEGIYLGDQLILTEETSASALGTDEIERVIKHFF
ncbi:MAG: hypothetical protein K6F63_07955 [Lachnospiraceae bacterium]|nr:hypothetical protein [Lachnospiraceae bacterium]